MYQIFISHAWDYNRQYETVYEWIKNSKLLFRNYSVPKKNPLHAQSKTKLKEDLTEQIKHANCVIIISGMYAAYSDWIDYEIDEAVRMNKYIIGIKPWGQERVPSKVQIHADVMVGWNSLSLINAIKSSK